MSMTDTVVPEKNAFQCAGYRKRTTECTAHNIREMVLDQIVLDDLKRMTAFARDEPDKFYEAAMQKAMPKSIMQMPKSKRISSKIVSKK